MTGEKYSVYTDQRKTTGIAAFFLVMEEKVSPYTTQRPKKKIIIIKKADHQRPGLVMKLHFEKNTDLLPKHLN